MSNDSKLPDAETLCLKTGLYAGFELFDANWDYVEYLKEMDLQFDCYCIECERDSFFKSPGVDWDPNRSKSNASYLLDGFFSRKFVCTRNSRHRYCFHFAIKSKKLFKIGQFPSFADLNIEQIKKYRNTLGTEKWKEFSTSVGLFSHDVGIGSFVYLRRIFEFLIEEAHAKAAEEENWNEEDYLKARVPRRIQILGDKLPSFMVENSYVYGILSKAVHELKEEECLKYYVPIKSGIELILDQRIEEENRVAKLKEAQKQIAAINQEIS